MRATDEAVILAGGLGTRLRGVVDGVPKPMAQVAGRPFLAWVLDALAAQGLRRVVLATGYLGEQVEAAMGRAWGRMALAYSREPAPLGTGGALALALQQVAGDACFVLNGDTWLALDYATFARDVRGAGARLGVALAEVPDVARYGAARLAGQRVVGFAEKGGSGRGCINAGVYWLQRVLLEGQQPGAAFSFERDVLLPAVARETVVAYTHTQDFIDIGIPDDFHRAQAWFGPRGAGR